MMVNSPEAVSYSSHASSAAIAELRENIQSLQDHHKDRKPGVLECEIHGGKEASLQHALRTAKTRLEAANAKRCALTRRSDVFQRCPEAVERALSLAPEKASVFSFVKGLSTPTPTPKAALAARPAAALPPGKAAQLAYWATDPDALLSVGEAAEITSDNLIERVRKIGEGVRETLTRCEPELTDVEDELGRMAYNRGKADKYAPDLTPQAYEPETHYGDYAWVLARSAQFRKDARAVLKPLAAAEASYEGFLRTYRAAEETYHEARAVYKPNRTPRNDPEGTTLGAAYEDLKRAVVGLDNGFKTFLDTAAYAIDIAREMDSHRQQIQTRAREEKTTLFAG